MTISDSVKNVPKKGLRFFSEISREAISGLQPPWLDRMCLDASPHAMACEFTERYGLEPLALFKSPFQNQPGRGVSESTVLSKVSERTDSRLESPTNPLRTKERREFRSEVSVVTTFLVLFADADSSCGPI